MASAKSIADEKIRSEIIALLTAFFQSESGGKQDVIPVKSNKFCFPTVNENGDGVFCEITVSIPRGSKDEDYDGYALGESYQIGLKEKQEKAEQLAKSKAKKIAKDKKVREEKADKQGE